jgi:tRNA 2-thiouridine synthesizing protein A
MAPEGGGPVARTDNLRYNWRGRAWAMADDPRIALTVDARGLACPLPVIRAKQALGGVQVGDVIRVLATDPGAPADFAAWARSTGHELVRTDREESAFVFDLKRMK